MAKSDLIQKRGILFALQMKHFKDNIGKYAVMLELSDEQVAEQAADADYYYYVFMSHFMVQSQTRSWTALKESVRRGKESAQPVSPASFTLPDPVPPVAPGVERRFRKLVQLIKFKANYNVSIGIDLGIEAVDQVAPDLSIIQPKLTAIIKGDRVQLGWDWQGQRAYLDMCELQADRRDGKGFVTLTYTITPGYTDPTPFPDAPVKWLFRAIYRLNDAQVGRWSNTIGIIVSQ
jgi:hypothetical protein